MKPFFKTYLLPLPTLIPVIVNSKCIKKNFKIQTYFHTKVICDKKLQDLTQQSGFKLPLKSYSGTKKIHNNKIFNVISY